MVYRTVHRFAYNVPVIVCPTPNDGVELYDQVAGSCLLVGVENLSDLCQMASRVSLGRFDK